MGYIGTENISESRISQSLAQDSTTPIDCIWTITVAENYQIFIKFDEPQLKFPNDCHLNYLQVRECVLKYVYCPVQTIDIETGHVS